MRIAVEVNGAEEITYFLDITEPLCNVGASADWPFTDDYPDLESFSEKGKQLFTQLKTLPGMRRVAVEPDNLTVIIRLFHTLKGVHPDVMGVLRTVFGEVKVQKIEDIRKLQETQADIDLNR